MFSHVSISVFIALSEESAGEILDLISFGWWLVLGVSFASPSASSTLYDPLGLSGWGTLNGSWWSFCWSCGARLVTSGRLTSSCSHLACTCSVWWHWTSIWHASPRTITCSSHDNPFLNVTSSTLVSWWSGSWSCGALLSNWTSGWWHWWSISARSLLSERFASPSACSTLYDPLAIKGCGTLKGSWWSMCWSCGAKLETSGRLIDLDSRSSSEKSGENFEFHFLVFVFIIY